MGTGGMLDLRGWTFATPEFWLIDIQERDRFTKGTGVIAIADGDEWNDAPGAGRIDTTLNAPTKALPAGASKLRVQWDNSYRQEDDQTAEAFVEFDSGERVTLVAWGLGSPEKDDINSHRDEVIDTPEGATSATVKFRYVAGNNWWWAIDNVQIDAIDEDMPREFLTTTVEIAGTVKVGSTLTADLGAWVPQPEQVTYQWLRDGRVIRGATDATYTVANGDRNKRLQVVVTARSAGFADAEVVSEKTVKVPTRG